MNLNKSQNILKILKNKKGITLIMVALMLILLIALAALAIDIAYMYVVKNELQVAADAAALAGAAKLTGAVDSGGTVSTELNARQEAWKFACKNKAAGSNVYLVTNSSTSCDSPPNTGLNGGNDSNGDIVVGNWDPATKTFTPATGNTNLTINAIKVRPRRTSQSASYGMPPVSIFFGRVIGWNVMSAQAEAIAARPQRAQVPIVICLDTCASGVISPTGTLLYWAPYPSEVIPGNVGIAWTSFNTLSQQMEPDKIKAIICGKEINACGLTVYTNNGNNNSLQRQLRCAFKNPLYDSANKTCADGNCNSTSDTVTSWTVLVAIVQSPNGCPPGDEPDPDTVVSYGRMTITEVYASGGGGTSDCACGAYDAPAMTGSLPNAIRVTSIQCLACPATEFLGGNPVLVK